MLAALCGRLTVCPVQAAGDVGLILGDFGVVTSLAHAHNLLLQHGVRAFYYFLVVRRRGRAGALSCRDLSLRPVLQRRGQP